MQECKGCSYYYKTLINNKIKKIPSLFIFKSIENFLDYGVLGVLLIEIEFFLMCFSGVKFLENKLNY